MLSFLALAVLMLDGSSAVLGEDAAKAAAATQVAVAKPRGLKTLPPGIDVVRDFLDKANEKKAQKMKEDFDNGAQLDFCIVNSWVAFNYLTQAFLEIESSVSDCKDVVGADGATERTCAADVFGVLQCFFSTGGYVAGLVTQCGELANAEAQCASLIVAWFGSLTEMFQAVLSLPQTCGKFDPRFGGKGPARRLSLADGNGAAAANSVAIAESSTSADEGRRLGTGHSKANHPLFFQRGAGAAWCYLQITSALAYLAQAGVNMGSAARNCDDQSTKENRAACATDINGLFSSLSDVVSFVGGAASLCAKTLNNAGLCAGDVGTLGNALGGLGASSAAFRDACGKGVFSPAFDPGSRRLSEVAGSNYSSILPDGLRKVVRRLSDRFDIPAPDMDFV